ncbi:AraC family transcriptional regulator [Hydrocarboniclastica marina]|uniref:AraC family transcriptional regulator n=1 Tax=Hydrocarboniclastica marina TaxID=2259620 RepID=A0A4P7XGU0_9ALTE|nr:AraC family transcriptional regulator [Hydrocarboniclastica marina]QCF25412.1 AraC family transcriptional regulator [Hydrocarboniclastica marina]
MTPPYRHPRTNPLGDIDVTYAAVMRRVLEQRGLPAGPLFDRFDLNSGQLAIPQARISIPRFMRLGHAACELADDSTLGLAMGQATRLTDVGMAGLAGLAAPTLGSALATLIHFERLTSYNSRGKSRMDTGPTSAAAVFYSISPYNAYNYFVVDAVLARWLTFIRMLEPSAAPVREVHIEYRDRGVCEVFERFFGCPVLFGSASNALILDPAAMSAPNPLGQPALFKTLHDSCARELEKLKSGWTLVDRVKEELAPRLRGGSPGIDAIAAAIGTTPWTLRRALAEQGKTFRQLLGETRQALALEYIGATRLSFAEIAYLLGFASPAPFHRAVRRWTGLSAGQYRRDVQSSSASSHSSSSASSH